MNENVGKVFNLTGGGAGAAAGFGSVTATVDSGTGTPSVSVTASGPDSAKDFAFTFKNLKGDTGATGPQGPKGDTGDTGPQGPKGDTGARGAAGAVGKSAYEAAKAAGYTGTEANFNAALLTLKDGPFLPTAGGTITGNLLLKGSGNYGNKLNFGDGDLVHISEPTDDCLEIKAKKVNFVLSDTSTTRFTINGSNPFSGGADIPYLKGTGTADANTTYGSTALGAFANASGQTAVALGSQAKANANATTAVGCHANASGDMSTALGNQAEARALDSTALGADAYANGFGDTALGFKAQATAGGSVALGHWAATANAHSIQLGNASTLSSITAKVGITVTSDERDKADVKEIDNGATEF